MCLISKYKLSKIFRYVKKVETYASPGKHKFKNIKFCLIKVTHMPHL